MQRTYCDHCGAECTGKIGRLMLVVRHETSQREHVGEDECRPLDLCGHCTEEARAAYRFKVIYSGGSDMSIGRAVDFPHP